MADQFDRSSFKMGEPILPKGWVVERRVLPEVKPETIVNSLVRKFVGAWMLQRALRRLGYDKSYAEVLAVQTVVNILFFQQQIHNRVVIRRDSSIGL